MISLAARCWPAIVFVCIHSIALAETRLPPNIILIMADDLGYETLGCNGGVSYPTPNLDRMARQGVRFEHCYSQPLCTPSRVKLMTGKSNCRNYVQFGYLDTNQRTFAHDLQDAGYATVVVGKWQLNGTDSLSDADDLTRPGLFGFDRWRLWQVADSGRVDRVVGGKTRRIDARYADPVLNTDGDQSDVLVGKYGPDLCTQFALDFIDQNHDRPFLVYYPMILTHGPFYPTPHSDAWSDPKQRKRSGATKSQYFGDMVQYMDHLVGRIVDRLGELGIAQNTYVIFTGDNGTDRSVTSRMSDGQEVHGGKGLMNDRGTHVPLIVWKSDLPNPGRVSDALVDFSDFAPTLAEIARTGGHRDERFDGQSFLGAVTQDTTYQSRDDVHIWYQPNKAGSKPRPADSFARNGRFKLYENGNFFDLSVDPEEQDPLAPDSLSPAAKTVWQDLGETLSSYRTIDPALITDR